MIKTYTWNRDSHGLFDYESKGIIQNQFKIPEPGRFLKLFLWIMTLNEEYISIIYC